MPQKRQVRSSTSKTFKPSKTAKHDTLTIDVKLSASPTVAEEHIATGIERVNPAFWVLDRMEVMTESVNKATVALSHGSVEETEDTALHAVVIDPDTGIVDVNIERGNAIAIASIQGDMVQPVMVDTSGASPIFEENIYVQAISAHDLEVRLVFKQYKSTDKTWLEVASATTLEQRFK